MMHFASVHEDAVLFKGWAATRRLQMPVIGIGGEVAAGGYPEMALRAFSDSVSGAVIPKAGHWIAEEQPEALTERLLGFL